MNKIYKVIWSKVKNCYVVASELAKSHTKSPKSGVISKFFVAGVLACVLSCGAVLPAYAASPYSAGGGSASGNDAIAIGGSATAGMYSVSLGAYSSAPDQTNIAIGYKSAASAARSISIGAESKASQNHSIAIGQCVVASAERTVAIGDSTSVTASSGIGIGSVGVKKYGAIGIGSGSADGISSISIGISSTSGNGSIAIGGYFDGSDVTTFKNTSASGNYSIALGAGSSATALNSVAIGYDSVADTANTISVGNSSTKRKIVNVANGTAANDAATYGQLKPAIKALSVSGKTITYTKIDGSTGTITTQDTDTHYTTHLYAGSGTAANANTTNGNTKLTLADNSTVRESITIKGTGATTVTSSGGVITINSTDNNTTYSPMTGATASAAGTAGLVPAPAAGKQTAFLRGDGTWVVPTDTNTHYTTHLYAGTGAAANAATSNGSTKIALTDDSTVRNTLTIKGTGATTVTSDANGVITINSTDNNTTYSAMSADELNTGTATTGRTMTAKVLSDYVKGKTDDKITGLSVSGQTITYTRGDGTTGTITTQDTNTTYSAFTGATSSAAGTAGLVKAPAAGDQNKFLRGDGTWAVDNDTKYTAMTASEATTGTGTTARSITAKVLADYVGGKVTDAKNGTITDLSISGKTITYTKGDGTTGTLTTQDNNTTYSAGTGLSLSGTTFSVNTNGSVASGNAGVLNGGTVYSEVRPTADGTFAKKANTTAANITALDTAAKNAIKALSVSGQTITYTKGDGTTGTITTQDNNTTYSAFTGATASAAGTAGLVKAPAAGDQNKFLRGDGTWAVDNDTKYTNMSASELNTGTATTARSISAKVISDYVTGKVSAETTARTTAINSEATTRADADTALGTRIDNAITAYESADTGLSNRIGSLSADGNYIKKSATNNVSANLTALDTQLKTTATAVGTETTNRTNADTALSNRIGSVASDGTFIKKSATNDVATNLTALDTAAKNAIKTLSVSGTTITYTKGDGTTGTITTQDTNTTYGAGTADNLTIGTDTTGKVWTSKVLADYVKGQVATETTNRTTAVSNEATARSEADTALSNRIGSLTADGNYIKKSATNNVSANLTALDTQLKTTTASVSTEATTRANADTALETRIDNVTSAYQSADTGLSNRIGSLTADGNYIKKADTNNVSENLTVLDTQLKSLEDRLGSATVAEGSTGSTSIGDGSGVNGDNSVSIGDGSGVTGDNSVAIGVDASTNESDTVAVGGGSSASGEGSTSLGAGTSASGTGSTALGGNAYSSGDGSVALGNDSVAGTDGVVSVGHKAGDSDANGNTYTTNEFRRIINVANGIDDNDAATVGQVNTAVSAETTARTAADAVLSDRIGTLTADGNYIKKSDTNNVSQNLTVLDTELKTLADRIGSSTVSDGSTGSTAMGDGSEVTGNNSVGVGDNSKVTGDDSVSVGTGSSVEGNDGVSVGNDSSVTGDGSVGIGSGTTVDADNAVAIGKDSEVTANNGIALGSEASSTEEGAIAIGSGSSASGVNAISLGTGAEASGNHSTALGDGANASADNSVALGSNSVADTADVISVGHKVGDTDANGNTYTTNEFRRIINVANGVDDNDAVTVGQMNQQIAIINNYNTSLDARIGTIASDGNYIRSSATNDVAANLMALDTQLKATDVSSLKYDGADHSLVTMGGTNGTVLRNVKGGLVNETSMEAVNGSQLYAVKQDITGFASDIQANASNIDALNSSVTAALSSVSASGVLVDTLDSSKADKSLSNLSDAGKRVLKTYAEDAVATYLAEQGLSIPAAPMAMNNGTVSNGNTLSITNAGNGSLHVGEGSYVNGTSSIAIGVGNQVNANNSGAFGDPSIINADESYVLGNDDTINTGATGSFIVGNDGVSDAKGGLLFGSNTKATVDAENGMALGNRSEVSAKNAIALGSGSIADSENTLSIGNSDLKRKIVNVADGDISQNSSEAVTGAQLYVTNENVKKNAEVLEMKANVDAGNINTSDWATKLGIGKVEDGNADLVTGGTVYDAIQSVKGNELVQTNGDAITIGATSTATMIDVSNANGQGRAITGIVTDVNDASSAANVGYVNQVGENIINATNSALQRVDNKINKAGANAAAIANLPTPTFDGEEKWAFAVGIGRYQGETAGAVGAFYRPTDNVIARVSGSFGNGDEMVGAGVAVSLNKGNTPAVSKAQLVRTINAQANEIQGLKAGREADRAEIAELKAMVADLAAKVK